MCAQLLDSFSNLSLNKVFAMQAQGVQVPKGLDYFMLQMPINLKPIDTTAIYGTGACHGALFDHVLLCQ